MSIKRKITKSPLETKKTGDVLAKGILKLPLSDKSFVIGLEGDLGGGKTTFLQGFAKGLGIKEKILSPTFVLMKKFKIRVDSYSNTRAVATRGDERNSSTSCRFVYFYHIDCYRIEKPKEILDLGFKEIISNPRNIVVIEWADRIRKIMPEKTIWIKFEFVDKNKRKIIIKYD